MNRIGLAASSIKFRPMLRVVVSELNIAKMLFYEPLFLILFPLLYVVYFSVDGDRVKKTVLLIASALFYLWGEPLFVPVVLISTLIDYVLINWLVASRNLAVRRSLLALGIAGNLAILIFYKYADFAIANLDAISLALGGPVWPLLNIVLPIGVSFVVFEKITYLVDSYRGVSEPASRFSDYCLFVLFFPKLLAGPILKYHEMERQIAEPKGFSWDDFWQGLLRFSRGIFKKLLIADPLGRCADQIFAADSTSLGAGYAWLGVVCFTLQIYFDFSGYSDMAIGIARMLGFRLRENFNMPYIARSLTEFWQRWHISLTTWIRDYLYIPLGGNRVGSFRIYRNLWICFLLSGLWHGASWNFVLWGAYNGLFLTLDRLFLARLLQRSGALISTAVTLLIVMAGWVIFRSTSLSHLGGYFSSLAGFSPKSIALPIGPEVPLTIALGVLLSLLPALPKFDDLQKAWRERFGLRVVGDIALVLLYVIATARAVAIPFQPFIYFRF